MWTRREFILSGIATAAATTFRFSSERPQCRVAIIGVGRSGTLHLAVGLETGTKLSCICDHNAVALINAQRVWQAMSPSPFGAQSDYRRILDDPGIDVVICATPPKSRPAIIVDSLRAGKHVYSVPPIGSSYEEGQSLMKVAERERLFLWQGSTDPLWNTAALAESLRSVLHGNPAKVNFLRNTYRMVSDGSVQTGWFDGFDLLARMTGSIPSKVRARHVPGPLSAGTTIDYHVDPPAELQRVVVASKATSLGESWEITARTDGVTAQVWAGTAESSGETSRPGPQLGSWREFLSCWFAGNDAEKHNHAERAVRALAWLKLATDATTS